MSITVIFEASARTLNPEKKKKQGEKEVIFE